MLARWGRFVARRAWWVVGAWVLVLVAAGAYGAGAIDHLSNEGGYNEQADSYTAYRLYSDHFQGTAPDFTVLYSSDSLTVDDPRFGAAVRAALATLPADKVVRTVDGLGAPPQADMVSADRHAVRVDVSMRQGDVPQMVADYRAVKHDFAAGDPAIRTETAGILPMGDDMLTRTAADSARAEAIALPIVFVLSLVIFGGLVAAVLPPVIGGIAVTVSLATLRLVTEVTKVSATTMMIVTLLGMGLAIDYCLFVISRFREELGTARDREATEAALGTTLAHAGRTVVVSALIVSVSMASLLVVPLTTVRSIAYGAVPAVLTAMLASVTLLPALLALLGQRINALRLPGMRARRADAAWHDTHGAWARVAHHVMRRPWVYLLAVTAVLLALGTPTTRAQWGAIDLALLPKDAAPRVAQQHLDERFGGGRVDAFVMYVGDPAGVPSYVEGLRSAGATPLAAPAPARTGAGEPVTFLPLTWPGTTQSPSSHEMVQRLRELPSGAGRAYVGGESAAAVDQIDLIGDRLPLVAGVVVAAMLVLLGGAFRSLVLPVKAVLVSALSISASFGVVVWVFLDGHLSGPLGFEPPGFLEVTTPLIMAAILFGLSMDYEVFLLSRIQEDYARTGDNTASVAHGLARTGGIITGAAVLLAVVVAGFVGSSIVFMKMVGLGMLVAILADATIVRGVLVPATMRLLGRWNWWPGVRRRPEGP